MMRQIKSSTHFINKLQVSFIANFKKRAIVGTPFLQQSELWGKIVEIVTIIERH